MKKLILLIFTAASLDAAEPIDTLASRLQNISVTLHAADGGQCSGSLITRNGQNYVLSAGHCVEDTRTVENIIGEDGSTRLKPVFPTVEVVKELYADGQSVGTTTVEADVLAYSSPEHGHDLLLLKLRSPISKDSTEFSPDKITAVGTELVHIGSLKGQVGSNSFTTGGMAQIGRVLYNHVFDQTSCTAFPGSSGGGVFLRSTGQYVGTLVRGSGEQFNLIVPNRRIRQFADAHRIPFLFDAKAAVDESAIRLEVGEPAPEKKRKFSLNLGPGDDSLVYRPR